MIGFGDPVFGQDDNPPPADVPSSVQPKPSAAKNQPAAKKPAATAKVPPRVVRQATDGVEIDDLGGALRRLPQTSEELKLVATRLGVPPSDIHLGQDASEIMVKRASLADYRIVYFATHGLVADQVKGISEPSLALSTPARRTDLDDGLLTASEVAQLKLNADWVVLSACNTAAGDKYGAEELSGLARSFFYAGARALLVSHWEVETEAATSLTTTTFARLKANPGLGRAGALREAMLAYLGDPSSPGNAYPASWGPFALVGEGAAKNGRVD